MSPRRGLPILLLVAAAGTGAACRNFGEPPPGLAVSPHGLAFSATATGVGPPPRALTIDAIGVGELTWAASTDVPWLSVAPTRGTAPAVAWVAAAVAGLGPGEHAGAVRVTTTSGPVMQATVPVTLSLGSVVSLTGRWAGGLDTVGVTWAITQTDTVVAGSGTLNLPYKIVAVAGSFRNPAVRLRLTAPDSAVTIFDGSLVDENTIRGVLNGGRLASFAITMTRQ